MKITPTPLFLQQLQALLLPLKTHNPEEGRRFKLYLDTILLNIPSKAGKYKPSVYFDDEAVRDIEHQGYTIPFYHDRERHCYVLLGIINNRSDA